MKKSLIALAALAATASFAQSSVQIDGIMDAGFQSINYKGTSISGIAGNGSSTSALNIRGTEDLGGGLKADFRVETNWNLAFNRANTGAAGTMSVAASQGVTSVYDVNGNLSEAGTEKVGITSKGANATAGSFANGELRVGLEGGFGRVDLGAVNFNALGALATGNPFGTAIGGGYGSLTRVDAAGTAVRSDSSVKYTSPSFGGLNVTLYKANKQTKGPNANDNFSASLGKMDLAGSQEIGLNYANGPLAVSYSHLVQDFKGVDSATGGSTADTWFVSSTCASLEPTCAVANTTGSTKSTLNLLGANYTMGAVKLFGLYQTNKNDAATPVDTRYMSGAVAYTMGATTLTAQVGKFHNHTTDKNANLVGLGADYALSKRTAVYARYESIKDDNTGANAAIAPVAGLDGTTNKRTRAAIGLRHAF